MYDQGFLCHSHFLNQFCISDDSLGIVNVNTGYQDEDQTEAPNNNFDEEPNHDDEDENKSPAINDNNQEQKIQREASKTDTDLLSGKISILKISVDISL